MAQKKSLTVSVSVSGMRETLDAFKALPKDAGNAIRDASKELAERLAAPIRTAAGRARQPQAAILAATIKVKRDRVPVLEVGGTKRIGRNKVPAWRLLFGGEFGSNAYRQFHQRHTGNEGTWFFPTVEREKAQIIDGWEKAADEIVTRFGGGGRG